MRKIFILIFLVSAFLYSCSESNNTAEDWINKAQKSWDGQQYTEPRKAIEYLNKAIQLQPNNADIYNKRGTAYYNLGDYQRTVEDDSEAIRLSPGYADAFNNRAGAYVKLEKYKEALEDYNQAIRFKPEYAIFHNNRAVVYLKQKKNKQGCLDAQKACELGDCITLRVAQTKGLCSSDTITPPKE
jgi:tetratricopeptide (TPR) repeat protein